MLISRVLTSNLQHDQACGRGSLFQTVYREIELQLQKAIISLKDKGRMKFLMAQFKKNIETYRQRIYFAMTTKMRYSLTE